MGGKSSGGGSSAKKSHKDHRDDFHGKLNDHSKGRVTAEGDNEVHGSSHVRNVVRAHSELHGMKVTRHEGGETHEDKHGNKIVLSKRGNKHVATFHAAEGKRLTRLRLPTKALARSTKHMAKATPTQNVPHVRLLKTPRLLLLWRTGSTTIAAG